MDNHEEILDALTAFGKNPNPQEIPSILEQYLNCVAKNGETLFPWTQLKPLILRKMELVINELRRSLASENIPTRPNVENVRFDVIHARIIDSLHKFNGAPFTIQRLCELLIDPKKHYKRSDKFMRGLEKNVLVVSTVDPFGRKVVCESGNKPMVNGIADINGSYTVSVRLPPVPDWVKTTLASTTPAGTPAATSETQPDSKTGVCTDAENSSKDGATISNGVPTGMAVTSSVFSDQGHPLAVHSEEVVEETVVTMDTSEVSSVVTDGGEAMAEGNGVERDLPEDREASFSSSSSSSSSSEELSTSSDSIETSLRLSPYRVPVHSMVDAGASVEDNNRPWAAFAQDSKPREGGLSHQPFDSQPVDNLPDEIQISQTSSSLPSMPPTTPPDATSPVSSSSSLLSETQSSLQSVTTTSEEVKVDSHGFDSQTSSSDKTLWLVSDDSPATNQSSHLEPVKSASDHICPDTEPGESLLDQDGQASSSSTVAVTSSHNDNSSDSPAPSSLSSCDNTRTYAQVVASSTDKAIHLEPLDSTDATPCDSVAGLERLVGSMEQSLTSSSSSSHSPSSSASVSCISASSLPTSKANVNLSSTTSLLTTESITGLDLQTFPTSSQFCSEEGEPTRKRLRLSMEEENMEEDCISTSGDSCMEGVEQTEEAPHHCQQTADSPLGQGQQPEENQDDVLTFTSGEVAAKSQVVEKGDMTALSDVTDADTSSNELHGGSEANEQERTSTDMEITMDEPGEENSAVSEGQASEAQPSEVDNKPDS